MSIRSRLLVSKHTAAHLEEVEAVADIRAASEFAIEHLSDVDLLINAAGMAAATSTDNSALLGANSALPYFLGRAAEVAGVPRFIHVSSAAVQGRGVLNEGKAMDPVSRYGFSKACGEVALLKGVTGF
ncbi:MAG: NAD-dependent epimerase/dehydratase family protein [Marmoricola sp.]